MSTFQKWAIVAVIMAQTGNALLAQRNAQKWQRIAESWETTARIAGDGMKAALPALKQCQAVAKAFAGQVPAVN